MARLKLDELAGGAAQEKFDRSFSKVAQNLMDVNCPFDKKRAITLQFEFAFKDESRTELEVKITSKESLAPQMPIRTQMSIGQDLETKKISVQEYGSSVHQKSPVNTNELEDGSEVTLSDGSVVNTDTGEVVNYRDINRLSINGYDMQQESIRSVMSKLLGMSETKIAELTVVINHLIDEFMTMLNDGTLGISVAYKIAGMSPDMQLEFFDYCENEPKITLNVVKDFKWLKESEYENQQIPGQSSIDDIKGDYDIEPENIESDVNNVIKALEHDSDAIEIETGQDDADVSSQAADVKDSIKSFDALMAEKHGKCDVNVDDDIELETHNVCENDKAADYIAGMLNSPVNEKNTENIGNNCEIKEEMRHSIIEYVVNKYNISLLQYIKSRIAMYCEDCCIKIDDEQMSTMSSYLSRDINALAEQYKYDD